MFLISLLCSVMFVFLFLARYHYKAEKRGFFLRKRLTIMNLVVLIPVFSGETGIRTPEPLLTVTRFPGVPLQPLEHLSLQLIFISDCKGRHFF